MASSEKAPKKRPKRRGRPPGSVSLTREKAERMFDMIRLGGTLEDAARSVGYRMRTVMEWLRRGLGLSDKPSNKKLKWFAEELLKAWGDAGVSAEVRVFDERPAEWHSKLRAELGIDEEEERPVSAEEILELAFELVVKMLEEDPDVVLPSCPNRRCRCRWHRPRTEDEQEEAS